MAQAALRIRSELRPGDIGRIIALHGACYASEHGLDASFEGYVAARVSEVVERGFPERGEGLWIAERGEKLVGCIALTREGEGRGQLRWFIVDPAERGSGLGRRLLHGLLEGAARDGYRTIELVTFSELEAAARLYRDAGFRCMRSVPERHWGRTLEMQRYELELEAAAIRGAA